MQFNIYFFIKCKTSNSESNTSIGSSPFTKTKQQYSERKEKKKTNFQIYCIYVCGSSISSVLNVDSKTTQYIQPKTMGFQGGSEFLVLQEMAWHGTRLDIKSSLHLLFCCIKVSQNYSLGLGHQLRFVDKIMACSNYITTTKLKCHN